VTLKGGGSRVFENLMHEWLKEFKGHSDLKITYEPSGSGAGIIQLQKGDFDYAVTDLPLTSDQVQKSHVVQFPMALTGIMVVANLKQVSDLKLSANVLTEIYLGKVTKWNDQKILDLNPTQTLPNLEITVMYREDSSGSTKYFASYLAKASRQWQQTIGSEVMVKWPVGQGVKGKAELLDRFSRTPGAITYADYASAKKRIAFYGQPR